MLSTAEVAAASGYSVQQVRVLEEQGVIPPATRAANGYRRFGPTHVRDLVAYRDLALAVGPVEARRVLREIRTVAPTDAAALVSALHTRLATQREEALAAQSALRAISAEPSTDAPAAPGDTMTIGELAGGLGVRASTLRFWEREGLLRPDRTGGARRYPLPAIREARIVAALRSAGYRIPDVRRALAALRSVGPVGPAGSTGDALTARLDDLGRRTLALLRAGTTLAAIVAEGQTGSRPSTTSAS